MPAATTPRQPRVPESLEKAAEEVAARDEDTLSEVEVEPVQRRHTGRFIDRVLVDGGRLTGVQFGETNVRDTVWRNVSADLAALRLADLVRMTFESCNRREADFTGAQCDWVRFHDCDLRGAIFSKARFTNSEFRRCRLEGIEGVGSLGGTAMALDAVLALAPALANELGIALLES